MRNNVNKTEKALYEIQRFIDPFDTIPAHFLDGCDRIERIVITGNVKEIGKGTFTGCSSLERIVLPSSLKRRPSHGCLVIAVSVTTDG